MEDGAEESHPSTTRDGAETSGRKDTPITCQETGRTPSRISSCLAERSKTAGGHLWARISRSK